MEEYKKKLKEIHAPEELIQKTIHKSHEEEKQQEEKRQEGKQQEEKQQKEKQQGDTDSRENSQIQKSTNTIGRMTKQAGKTHKWAVVSSLITVAAAVVLVVGLSRMNNEQLHLVYNTVPETLLRTSFGEQEGNAMDAESYSDYLGIDIQNLTENASLVKTEIYVVYEGENIVEDEATAVYNVDGEQVLIRFSKTMDTMPEALTTGEPSIVNGVTVVAGQSENEKERMAAFEYNGMKCFVISYSMDQEAFEIFLRELLESIR